jgi:hypothetical protein
MRNEFEVFKAETTIKRVAKAEIGFCPIIRVPIRTQAEADAYMREGVAIYEKTTKTPNGECRYYFVEVSLYDLAKVAQR